MQELQDSWTLCANGCVNEITTITVIFNKKFIYTTTTIILNFLKRIFYRRLNNISSRVASRSRYNLVDIGESCLKLCYCNYTIRQQILHQIQTRILHSLWVNFHESYRWRNFGKVLTLTCVLTRARLLLTFL